MFTNRTFSERLQDRLWKIRADRFSIDSHFKDHEKFVSNSISGSMAWPSVCSMLCVGGISSYNFRRMRSVMEVVETLGPSDGRHHANLIRNSSFAWWLNDAKLKAIASWGNPMTWPGFLLGTQSPFAPSTLRYLSHAIWLAERGFIKPNDRIVEIGVGYGGLAAINALISEAKTLLVDLPEVERTAMLMLDEIGLSNTAQISTNDDGNVFDCFISNYAFTELTRELQIEFIQSYALRSTRGMILSNANAFALQIKGMNNSELVDTLHSFGINATITDVCPLYSPADYQTGSSLISW